MESVEAFGENIDEKVTTPACSHIFTVNKQAYKLDEEKSILFHLVVANLLYIMRGARPNLETPIPLLFRRVSKSDVDD